MQSQQFYIHHTLVKKCSLKPFLNFDNESAHIRESGNEFHLSIYLCQKEELLHCKDVVLLAKIRHCYVDIVINIYLGQLSENIARLITICIAYAG